MFIIPELQCSNSSMALILITAMQSEPLYVIEFRAALQEAFWI